LNKNQSPKNKLALYGGTPVRAIKMPPRLAVLELIEEACKVVVDYYSKLDLDPGYQGHFEAEYCSAFSRFMGGGQTDAVASGTAALYVAVGSLNLPEKSEVLVSSISDPGTYNAIILNGHVPKLVDTAPKSYNISLEQVADAISSNTRALLVVHAVGEPIDMVPIMQFANEKNIYVIEDCSQAHGASINGKLVGTYGHISAFSTGFKKNHVTNGSGGIVYSNDIEFFQTAVALADRGKPIWRTDYDDRDPTNYLFPALNLNTDEISCSIGLLSLNKLTDTILRRNKFVEILSKKIMSLGGACEPYKMSDNFSPFFLPIHFNKNVFKETAEEFSLAVRAEGIPLNPHYNYVASRWKWLKNYLADTSPCSNAENMIDTSFNIYLNENYQQKEASDICLAIHKVENILKGKESL
jgi:perosamine synthetase